MKTVILLAKPRTIATDSPTAGEREELSLVLKAKGLWGDSFLERVLSVFYIW